MPIRKILDIDLSQIERFTDLFSKYQQQLDRTRPAWAAIRQDGNATVQQFDRLTAALLAQNELARRMGAEERDQTRSLREQRGLWDHISHATASIGGHIVSATRSLLKWGSIIGGIATGAGLFGLDRLAATAGTGRREALGLGLSYGERRAFSTEMSPLVDPQQFLQGVFTAQHDLTQRWSLMAAGLTPQQMSGGTAQTGIALLGRLKQIADQTPEQMLAQVLQARGLDRFISLQDFERIKRTPGSEIQEWQRQYSTARPQVELTQQQQLAWQKLQVQLSLAGQAIETALIRNLTPLAPQFAHLSHAFVDLLNSALGSGTFRKWIDDAADGVEWLAKYIATPEFKDGLRGFVKGVGEFADAAGAAAKKIYHFFGGGASTSTGTPGNPATPPPGQAPPTVGGWGFNMQAGRWEYQRGTEDIPNHVAPGSRGPYDTATPPSGSNPGDPGWKYAPDKGWYYNPAAYRVPAGSVPSGLLDAVSYTESRGNPNAVSRAGAMGEYQFMPGTWAEYGQGSPFDPAQSRAAAARYFRKLLGEFRGDVGQAAAAYNWGEGNVERDIAQHGSAWLSYAPRETQNYVAQVLGRWMKMQTRQMQTMPRPGVRIDNQTGGSAIVSMAQLGA